MTQSQRAVVGCWGGDSWGEMQEHKVSLQTGATITTWCQVFPVPEKWPRNRDGTQLQLRTNNWTSQVTGYKNSQVVFSKKVVVVVAVLSIYLSIYEWLSD